MEEKDFTMVLIKQVPGTRLVRTEDVIAYILKNNFLIIEPRWLIMTEKETRKFCDYDNDWLLNAGGKILLNCKEGNIDPISEFGTDDLKKLGELVKDWNIAYLLLKPLLALEIIGPNGNVVEEFRKLLGHTNPKKAGPKTIRRIFSDPNESGIQATKEHRAILNSMHASDTQEQAQIEKDILWNATQWSPYD